VKSLVTNELVLRTPADHFCSDFQFNESSVFFTFRRAGRCNSDISLIDMEKGEWKAQTCAIACFRQ
jgi:hypothetical protein